MLKRITILLSALVPLYAQTCPTLPTLTTLPSNGLAMTPPMGWNSWTAFRGAVSETLIKQQADALVSTGLAALGYDYVNVDDLWQMADRNGDGNLVPDTSRFPNGMKAVADYVHSKGLKFGIYTSPGPTTCGERPGSYQHEAQDATLFASWGVDYLKYDWCSTGSVYQAPGCTFTPGTTQQQIFQLMAQGLRSTGRSIVYSVNPGLQYPPYPWASAAGINLWRTSDDARDAWSDLGDGFGEQGWESLNGPGHWNDPDMLTIGMGGMTDVQYRTEFSVWAMLSAPLILNADITTLSSASLTTVSNAEVIAVDQDALGVQARVTNAPVCGAGYCITYVKPLSGGRYAVALVNDDSAAHTISATWSGDLGVSGPLATRDVWTHSDLGNTTGYSASVPAYATVMLTVGSATPALTVTVESASNTQALLRYTAPDASACTVEVGQSPTYSPLVPDVDGTLFAGANLDSRAGSLSVGRSRTVVVGKRAAEVATDGVRYSRALQVLSPYYYRVTCGSTVATGTFTTANIPLGSTYAEPFPMDFSDRSVTTYGHYAYPTFDWGDPTQTLIDPQTGVALRRASIPHMVTNDSTAPVGEIVDVDGAWNLSAGTTPVSFTGPCPTGKTCYLNPRFARLDTAFRQSYQIDDIQFGFAGSASGSTVGTGQNASIDVCLTLDGKTCYGRWITQSLTGSCSAGCTIPNNVQPVQVAWLPKGLPRLSVVELYSRYGSATVAGSTVTYSYSSGGVPFELASGNGLLPPTQNALIKLGSPSGADDSACTGGTDYSISEWTSYHSLTIAGPPTAGTYRFCVPGIGFLVRKTTSSADTITITAIGIGLAQSMVELGTPAWADGGFQPVCGVGKVTDGNGHQGYHCNFGGGYYFVNADTGETAFLGNDGTGDYCWWSGGHCTYPASPDIGIFVANEDGWGNQICGPLNLGFDPASPRDYYCTVIARISWIDPGKVELVKAHYAGDFTGEPGGGNGAGRPNTSFTNMTPASSGNDLQTLLHAFDSSFDPNVWSCSANMVQDHYVLGTCSFGPQDSPSWFWAWDIGNSGIVGAGGTGHVAGLTNSFGKVPCRWCGNHAPFFSGHINWFNWSAKWNYTESAPASAGVWYAQAASSVDTGLTVCPSNSFDVSVRGQTLCSTLAVDGQPCSFRNVASYHLNNGGGRSSCFGQGSWNYLQDAQPGDEFAMGDWGCDVFSNGLGCTSEKMIIEAQTDATHWVVRRAVYGTPIAEHNSGDALVMKCSAGITAATLYDAASVWWDFVNDPHGDNMQIDTIFNLGHRVYRGEVFAEGGSVVRVGAIPAAISQPATAIVNEGPDFAGAFGPGGSSSGDSTEEHESLENQTAGSAREKRWFMNAKPIMANGTAGQPATGPFGGAPVAVGGTTSIYKYVITADWPSNSAGNWAMLNRKQRPTLMTCGKQQLQDISSPSATLPDGPTGQYQYCVANQSGECRTGASAGDVYFNCPAGTQATVGCVSWAIDTCISNMGTSIGAIDQLGITKTDPAGAMNRTLTKAFYRQRLQDGYWNAKPNPDAQWGLVDAPSVDGRSEILAFKIPAYPDPDSVNRGTFVPVTVSLSAPVGTHDGYVEFGYVENGKATDFYCTSRQEACVAQSATINESNPFAYKQTETVTGMSCASGCAIAIPAISGRVLYYRWTFRNAGGAVIGTSSVHSTVVP